MFNIESAVKPLPSFIELITSIPNQDFEPLSPESISSPHSSTSQISDSPILKKDTCNQNYEEFPTYNQLNSLQYYDKTSVPINNSSIPIINPPPYNPPPYNPPSYNPHSYNPPLYNPQPPYLSIFTSPTYESQPQDLSGCLQPPPLFYPSFFSHPSISPQSSISSFSTFPLTNHKSSTSRSKNTYEVRRKLHLCKVCLRSFTTTGHLARHNRIHTGERKHRCPWPSCEARFSRQDNCMQHYKTHTNAKLKRSKVNYKYTSNYFFGT